MSKYEVGLKTYQAVRDDFIAGKTAREIGLQEQMEPIHVLGFLKWIGREFEIERIARSDQLKARLLQAANGLAVRLVAEVAGHDPSRPIATEKMSDQLELLERIRAIFAMVSSDDQTWLRERAERRHLWKNAGKANGGGKGGIDELIPTEEEGRRGRGRPR